MRPLLFALAYLLVPMVLYGVFARVRPAWQDRYLFVALPGYFLVAAWALDRLHGHRRALLAASLALLYAGGMAASFTQWRKDDWRGVARAIEQATAAVRETNGEVLITMPFQQMPFDYYYRGDLPRTGFPEIKRPLGPQDATVADALASRLERRTSVFVVVVVAANGDPDLLLVRRLAARHGGGTVRRFVGIHVFAFGKAAHALEGQPLTPHVLAVLAQE